MAVTPDGARIVTGSDDKTARIWDAKTGAELARLKGHTGAVTSVAVTPDGARIVTGSDDNTARIWDAKTGAELATLKGHTGTVTSVAVTPDGARIVTGSDDKTVRIWDLFPAGQALIEQAKRVAPRCLTPAQRERYHLASTPPGWCDTIQKWPYDAVTVAEDHMQAERWRDAITAFTSAIALDPKATARLTPRLAAAHYWIAWKAFLDVALRGKPADGLIAALVDGEKAVALAPDDESILDTRGQIHLALGHIDEAFADLDKAIKGGLIYAGTFYGRGRVHELKGNKDAAITDYRKVLELISEAGSSLDDYQKSVQAKTVERLRELGATPPVAPDK